MANSISILVERLSRQLQTDAHSSGLKPTQWEALRYLARANRYSQNPSALTSYLGITKGTVSQTLLALARKGLVKKQISTTDRREVKLTLTRKGMFYLENHDPLGDFNKAVKALSRHDQKGLGKSLETILQELLAHRQGRAFGACKSCRYFRPKHAEGNPHFCALLSVSLSRADREKICAEQEPAI